MEYPGVVLSMTEAPCPGNAYRMHEEYEPNFLAGAEEEEHPMWATERIELRSVGIDIGSSTSHLMFSRLVLRRLGVHLSSRYVVISREITWKSPILLTPYVSKYQIDVVRLSAFLEENYRSAGMNPDMIDTGAVIITGEAARKENAEAITALFSKQAGKFVCATAGPNLEAMMAAYGSGAVKKSLEMGRDKTFMVVDVGGGTSKIAIVQGGLIRETAATNVGGRLVALENGQIVRVEDAAQTVAEELGIRLQVGGRLDTEEKEALTTRLADILFETIDRRSLSPVAERLMITPALNYRGKIDSLVFSGGVGEYVYGIESRDYGDLGRLLGQKIMDRVQQLPSRPLLEAAEERIRATVIGASQYTIQVSGNTIFVSNQGRLPLRNLRVVAPHVGESLEGLNAKAVESAIRQAFSRVDLVEGEEMAVLAFHWLLDPRYELLRCLADGIVSALKKTLEKRMPILLVFNSDIGNMVGRLLQEECGITSDIVSVDQVHLHDFDYIDIGQIMATAGVVPIVVKSLVFGKHAEESLKERELKKHHLH